MISRRSLIAVLIFTTMGAGCMYRARFADRISKPVWPDFKSRVKNYTALVDRLDKDLAPVRDKATPEQIVAHKVALAKAIQSARSTARQGDIFTHETSERIRRIVRSETSGRSGSPAKAIIASDNPNEKGQPRHVTPAVNAAWTDGAPLSTMPPTLLLRLPVLPETLEYRFVGRTMVLRDVRANIIADYIPHAMKP